MVRRFIAIAMLTGIHSLVGQTPPLNEEIFTVAPGIEKPRLKHKEEPEYDKAALRDHVQGLVLLSVVIDQKGNPRAIEVISPLGYGLDQKAIEAVSRWRFRPGMKRGQPVNVRATVEISFRLSDTLFDFDAEQRRTSYNEVVSRLAQSKGSIPTAHDVETIKELASKGSAAARYLYGLWQMEGTGIPKDVANGFIQIRRSAEMNYAPAMYDVAQAQWQGTLMPKDDAKALALMQDAADTGSRQAQFALGIMYSTGDRVPRDASSARKYLQLCAGSGTLQCQFQLGKLLLVNSKPNNYHREQALAWLELADQHGVRAARPIVETEKTKLTPEEIAASETLRGSLEHK